MKALSKPAGVLHIPLHTWEAVAGYLPARWSLDMVEGDLVYWAARGEYPTHTRLARRWGWDEARVKQYLVDGGAL